MDYDAMTMAQLVEAYNKISGKPPIKKFETREKGIARLKSMTPKPPRGKRSSEWKQSRIKIVADQPRREGTSAYALWNDMKNYLSKNSRATVGEVIENTSYRPQDYRADLKRGNIEIIKE